MELKNSLPNKSILIIKIVQDKEALTSVLI